MSSCRLCSKTSKFMATALCGHVFCTSCLVTFVHSHSSKKCPICCVVISSEVVNVSPVILSQYGGVSKVGVRTVEKKKPVPRDPGADGTPYQKALFLQKTIKKDFNDNKIKFINPDGSDLLIAEYRKIATLAKEDPSKYFQGEYLSFDISDDVGGEVKVASSRVFIPKYNVIGEKPVRTAVVKKTSPVSSDPGEDSSLYERALFLVKRIKKDFNDNKGKFLKLDGTDFLLSDYHKLDDKKNLKLHVQGAIETFEVVSGVENPINTTVEVFIPLYLS